MKPIYLLSILIILLLTTNSSFVCIKFSKSITIDSIHYFKANEIRLNAGNFKDYTLQLNLHDGFYTFLKDTSSGYHLFKADKDLKNYYLLFFEEAKSFNDTSLIATLMYQSFDKEKQTNSSKIFHLKKTTNKV